MKTKLTLLLAFFFCGICFAQTGINYKAVVKDGSGAIVANQLIQVQFSILEGATIVYTESHVPTTDNNGLVILNIGQGTPVTGTFAAIDWASNNHFLNVQVNTGGGLIDVGTTQFRSVPYALSSADRVFEIDGDDAHKGIGNVGIGTTNPATRLHIGDANNASILLQTLSTTDITSLRLENGNAGGARSFFKLENQSDILRIAVDSDLTAGSGYADIMTIAPNGNINTEGSLALENGTGVNEFSTDNTLSGNSNIAVPTERAVKTYVDSKASQFTEATVSLLFGGSQTLATTSFVTIQATSSSSLTITNNTGFISVNVDVDGTITKFFISSTGAPVVVPYPGNEGSSLRIKVIALSGSKMLFFDGLKFTGNTIVGLLKVKD